MRPLSSGEVNLKPSGVPQNGRSFPKLDKKDGREIIEILMKIALLNVL